MGREVRRVPADWQHPKERKPDWRTERMVESYKPLYPGNMYKAAAEEFLEKANSEGLQEAIDWCGQAPDRNDYMPDWSESELTHYMMYEDTTEGTPISPAFETPEGLASWLVDNNASAFGNSGASYEGWLRVANGGYAPSMVVTAQGVTSGVDAL